MGKAAILALASALAACNPFGGAAAFHCTEDGDCSSAGTAGVCEPDGLCSFADAECASGRKYGELAGDKSNTCVGGDPGTDGPVDMMPDVDPADTCFGDPGGLAKPCFAPGDEPTGNVDLTGTLDTTDDPRCSTTAKNIDLAKVCVIDANTIHELAGTLRVTGSRSLVLVAATTIQIDGTIDAASHRGDAVLGPAADAMTCNAGTNPNGAKDGAAGGSYVGLGGTSAGGNAGVPGAVVPVSIAQGGCPGQAGGGGGSGGTAGRGGGVVYLIANTSIVVGGAINASGAGATGGVNNQAGGGGGGSGGLIGLDSPVVTNGGAIFANGGGGGEGGTAGGASGDVGDDPTVNQANGGNLSGSGGNGGNGAFGGTANGGDGQGGNMGAGNGGGGGGVGAIKLFRAATITGGQVSPNPS